MNEPDKIYLNVPSAPNWPSDREIYDPEIHDFYEWADEASWHYAPENSYYSTALGCYVLERECKWYESPLYPKWSTGCKNEFEFQFAGETPTSQNFTYCPYCGGKINEQEL